MRTSLRSILSILVFSAALTGCAPRGEARSVQEVLETSRAKYVERARAEQGEPLKTTLLDLSKSLEGMSAANGVGSQVGTDASKVADTLARLVTTAGYTSRASLGEIIMQHRVLGADASKGEINPARVKLLVARTYDLLSSELETTKFSVQPIARPV